MATSARKSAAPAASATPATHTPVAGVTRAAYNVTMAMRLRDIAVLNGFSLAFDDDVYAAERVACDNAQAQRKASILAEIAARK